MRSHLGSFFLIIQTNPRIYLVFRLLCTIFALASACYGYEAHSGVRSYRQSTTLWKSDAIRFVFDCLNVGNSNP